ncbi:MAG TPA: hypothetical protein VLF90_02820 [Patescibacteria group bacterium]|nr:hypothetical protein [Patescibacteria group bacterium]
MLDPKFILVGAAINLMGSLKYVIDTLRGKASPNRVSWILWAIAPLIAFAAEIGQGVGLQALMTFMVGFGPLMVVIASFVSKKAVWKLTKFDFVCGGLSVLGLILWLITRQGNIAILFSIIADGLASAPTVLKSYRKPKSESPYVFMGGAISAGITLLTIDNWTFAQYAFPLYIFLICSLMASLIYFEVGPRLRREI